IVRPKSSPSAQTPSPDMRSARPETPRNCAWERSGTTRFASPPSVWGAATWAKAREGASTRSASSGPRARRHTEAIQVMGDSLLTVEAVHGPLDALVQPALHRLGHRIEQVVEDRPLLGREAVEDEVGEVVVVHRPRPDADPEPGVVLAPERRLDALEPVVPPGAPRAAEAEAADVERHVVHQDDQVPRGIEAVLGPERGEHRPAAIHVGLGLDHLDRHAGPASLGHPRRSPATAKPAQLPPPGEPLRQEEAGVVPGPLVFGARIAQAQNDRQRLLLLPLGLLGGLPGFALALALRLLALLLRLPDELGLGHHLGFRRRGHDFLRPRRDHGAD